jgi:hypothetical protein
MARASKRVESLTAELEAAEDHATLADLGTTLHQAQSELEAFEEQWMEISLELEGH